MAEKVQALDLASVFPVLLSFVPYPILERMIGHSRGNNSHNPNRHQHELKVLMPVACVVIISMVRAASVDDRDYRDGDDRQKTTESRPSG